MRVAVMSRTGRLISTNCCAGECGTAAARRAPEAYGNSMNTDQATAIASREIVSTDTEGAVVLREARANEATEWDSFVESHPEGRFCQMWAYRRVLEATYGYRCRYVSGFVGGERVAVCPMIVSPSGASRLISQPFNEYGGPLTRRLSHRQYKQLAQELLAVARQEKCGSIEVRGGVGCEPLVETGLCVRHPLHSYGETPLASEEVLWRQALTNEARKGVNSARKAGLTFEVRWGSAAVADPFFHLYLVSMKRLGVPPHPRSFVENLAAGFGERLVACWVRRDEQVASVLVGLITGTRLQIYIIASAPEFWKERPNDLAHWGLMTWAVKQKLQVFDWGSARYPGQIQFKKKWGAQFKDYSYYVLAPANSAVSKRIQTVETNSKLMETAATLWRSGVPLPLTVILGRSIRRYLTK
jgi:hypothetical protein